MHTSSSHPKTRGSLQTPGTSKRGLEFQKLRANQFAFLALQASTLHITVDKIQLNFQRVLNDSFGG